MGTRFHLRAPVPMMAGETAHDEAKNSETTV